MTQTQINTLDLLVSKMAHGKKFSKALHEVYTKRNVAIPLKAEWLECNIDSLGMSTRTTAALLRNKIKTIGDVIRYTEQKKITTLQTFGRVSAIELFETILDYCWKHMSQKQQDKFIIDVVTRNSGNIRPEITL